MIIKEMKEVFFSLIAIFLGFAAVALILYGAYWVTKTLSYSFFYEDMVQRTITEMVKPEYLKKQ